MSIKMLLYFFVFFLSASPLQIHAGHDHVFTIMIEPAGDAKHAGRIIEDCFERGITLQYAEELKKVLEKKRPGIRIILSRFPGESLEPLQNAHFANRLGVDLYISINFFKGKEGKQTLYMYHFLYNPTTDYWKQNKDSLSFIPFDQAHKPFLTATKNYAQSMVKTLQALYNTQFEIHGIIGLPFKPLIGIAAPAIAIEASIHAKNDWKMYIEPLAYSLQTIIDQENR